MRYPLLAAGAAIGALAVGLVAQSPARAAEPASTPVSAPETASGAAESTLAHPAGAVGDRLTGGAEAGLAVEDFVFCAAIKDRAPIGVADSFPADIFSVYCYTRVVGGGGATSISHAWYRGDARVSETRLTVRSLPWRTWSTKEMRKEWKGDWRVDVLGPDGTVLASRRFYMK